ncbi:MAG: hypothetical protein ACREUX_09215, partial [Burkholderiales bacterium]
MSESNKTARWRHALIAAALCVLCVLSGNTGAAQSAGVVKTLIGSASITRESSVLPVAPGQRVF